ncbi:MAG: RDD family protein [Leptolyngbyaceae cyanobacterium MAG.088]|nr:RDD family protein [Leptolyngbyaceae cyanobacterium MAG.088]
MKLFNTVKIQTPESVELEFVLAGIGSRALAVVLDYVIVLLTLSILSVVASIFRAQFVAIATWLGGGTDSIDLWLTAIFAALSFAISSGYFVGFESLWQGQTPGKRLTKIRVIRDNGQPEGLFQATLRALLRPIDDSLFLGFFCILLGPQEKRIGDWLAGTLVVQIGEPESKQDLQVSKAAKDLSSYLVEEADMDKLLIDDFTIIREYLQRRAGLNPDARKKLSVKLAREVRSVLTLKKLPREEIPADDFLEAVYWAYQQQLGERSSYR